MDNNIYMKNRAALVNTLLDYDMVLEKDISTINISDDVNIYENANGEAVVAVKKNGYEYLLNSSYDSKFAAQEWAHQFEGINKYAPILIFGLGDGSHIKELRKVAPDNMFIVYEPDENIFYRVMTSLDMSAVVGDEKIALAVNGVSKRFFIEFIQLIINYANLQLCKYPSLPNYAMLYSQERTHILELVKSHASSLVFTRNTSVVAKEENIKNTLNNIKYAMACSDIYNLKESFATVNLENVPAIIVGAGPSLDKNIDYIKEAKGKAFIIAVDTALKTVLREGIQPDITISVDGHKPMAIFEHEKIKSIPLVFCKESNEQIMEKHIGKKIMFNLGKDYMTQFFERFGKKTDPLETGGSVANNAFSLAQYLGFKNIILVGMDLAYTDNKRHANASYEDSTKNVFKRWNNMVYLDVEDIYGNIIVTDVKMKMYIEWFEKQILRYEDLNVIDATEGGALIKGCKIMTFKAAIEQYCNETVDFYELINGAKTAFSLEEQKIITEEINKIPEVLDSLRLDVKRCIVKYDKLDELYRRNKFGNSESKRLYQEITEMSEKLQQTPVITLLDIYNAKSRYEAMEKALLYDSDSTEDIKEAIKMGKEVMESYLEAIEELSKDIESGIKL